MLAAVLGLAGAAPAASETLGDAIAMAYQANPKLQAQRSTQRAIDETYVQARAGWGPTVGAGVNDTYLNTRGPSEGGVIDIDGDGIPDSLSNGANEAYTANAALSLNQPLYTGGRVASAVAGTQADILAGRETLRRVETQVLSTVIRSYVDVRRDQEALRINQENVAVLQRDFADSQQRFRVGEITRTDVAQSQARLAGAQSQLRVAQAVLTISRAHYAAVVGQNPGELAPEPSLAGLMPESLDEAFAVAQQNSADLRAAQYAEQSSRARIAGAKAERLPQVGLAAGFGYSGPSRPIDADQYTRNIIARATVAVPLFTAGVVSSRIRQATERNSTDRINIETARRQVLLDLTESWSQLEAARANIASSQEQVYATRVAAEGARQELRVGLRTTLDVLNAEQELRNAQLAQLAARRDEYVAAAMVLAGMGRLEARNFTTAVPAYDPRAHFDEVRGAGRMPWEGAISAVDALTVPKSVRAPLDAPALAAGPDR